MAEQTVQQPTLPESKRNYLLPKYEGDYGPEESVAMQSLDRIEYLASVWWSVFEMLRECHDYGTEFKGTLPAWATERIGDWRQQHEAHDIMRRLLDDVRRAVAIAEGRQQAVFEIWTKKGHRLDGRYEFYAQADTALKEFAKRFPDAFICRVHYHEPIHGAPSAELLDTLIGPIYWAGASYPRDGEARHHVQDSTGRTIYVSASELMAHSAFERMTQLGKQRVAASH